ncbi:PREDICTED: histone-lysine N-methyltransferase ATXR4 [Camelina sativa]|uniref:Histone-lysine N-methyltransferase ATXR4 n=1 Tax=Camelina sativa TaxID=90675 RepID=A0ABM0V8P0_CAMSA|nr:PREDICTED: histone-lysine N-methyltransferase ATXR4 [Camelina sativa]
MSRLALTRYSRCYLSRLLKPVTPPLFYSSAATNRDDGSQTVPPPIRVGLTESAGRAVFATRRISAGDLIHTAKPVVACPSFVSLDSVCYLCLKKLMGSEKVQDRGVSYCSQECKENSKGFYDVETRADWSSFVDYCRTHNFKYPLMVKRLCCMIISGALPADCLDILQPAALSSAMISKIEDGYGLLWNAFRKANFKDDDVAFLTKQWYTAILARIRINAFRIDLVGGSCGEDLLSLAAASVECEGAVGHAVYMLPSFYNHDCDPNAHIIWLQNADARLSTLRDVEEGEELRICYIDASMGYEARQTILSQGFGFLCNCLRCQTGD